MATAILSEADAEIGVDDYIALDAAPAHVPGRPHRATIWRWALRGLNRRGEIIRLRTVAAGGRRFTTLPWITEFLARCNGDSAAATVSPGRRSRQAAAAMDTLQAMGVGSPP